jgi:glutamate-1-semialdehyde aminotransferase
VPYTAGVPKSAQDSTIQFEFGDLDQFEELISRHAENIACVIMTPIGHDARRPMIIPSKEYLESIRKITANYGIVLIFDEIRTGFRLALGGAQEYFDVVPDMATFSKAISNGFPLAAIAMKKELDASAQKAYISATYFPNSTPMEAALITLDEIEKNKLIDHVWKIGEAVQKGMQELSGKYDIPVTVSGLGPLFYMHFDEDFIDNTVQLGETTRTFYSEMINRGVFLNPIHNWFVCGAHTEEDVAQTLQAMEDSLKIVKAGR